MSKNYLLIYSERLATEIETLCQQIKTNKTVIDHITVFCF